MKNGGPREDAAFELSSSTVASPKTLSRERQEQTIRLAGGGQNMALTPISVTIEREFDLLRKQWENRVFVKLYVSMRTSGLLAKISDKDLRTLITLATFMDEDGRCYPSQARLAKALGITQAGVAKRMKTLLAFRWNGKPLVTAVKVRTRGGRFENSIYTILPETSLRIFDRAKGKAI